VRQGRTDAWIAHQLDVSVKDLRQFKRDHELEAPESADAEGAPVLDEDLDLRAADDELVAAALDSESNADEDEEDEEDEEGKPKRRRGRRGGRGRRTAKRQELEGTFDHGEEGYGLWLDPAIQDDPLYAEHWAGHRPITVTVEADRIVIRRAGEEAEEASPNGDDPAE
jgi:hypothetical protein